jgi:tRNA (cytidine32/uridine32-2'-O)-methyltransferase
MKTMGLTQLVLAEPRTELDGKSFALAAGADDVLKDIVVAEDLKSAVADCGLIIGSSARSRSLSWPMLNPRQAGQMLVAQGCDQPVALVFGRENHGLTNEELQLCSHHVAIPANPEYSSLNLAQAVQLLCYEARIAWLTAQEQKQPEIPPQYPPSEDMERFYEHLEQTLTDTGFIISAHPGQIMVKLRRLFNRARPEQTELNILRGVLTSINKAMQSRS